jgi:membrane-associated protein
MDLLASLWDFAVHLDAHLAAFVARYGTWVYALLFAIVFTETGVVIMPFLPGDSLLFVVGALAAAGGMDITTVMAVLVAAALTGDNVNYWIGRWSGPRVFRLEDSRWFSRKYLERTHAFYERHGGKAIIIARFVPIVRTYVPFVAGIGTMPYARFLGFSVAGALLWVVSLCQAGYWFGNIPLVKDNLGAVIVIIVAVSVTPMAVEFLRARRRRAASRVS